jgi:Ca-activated chloride channel family protein
VTHSNRYELKRQLARIRHGSSTNLGDGWLAGCREAALSAQEGTINRTILLTDGLANVGETNIEVLAKHAFELYKDSVSTSTFGVGHGFNEYLLEAMANKGGGNFHYISSPDQIPDIFLKEFNDLLGITARMVEVRLDLPKSIEWQVLGGWSTEYKDGHLHIHVGDMLSGKLQDIYIKLQILADVNANEIPLNAKVFGQDESGKVFDHQANMVFQFANEKEVEAAPVDQGVMERFALVELADEANEALKLERIGEREAAERRMKDSLARHRPHLNMPTLQKYQSMSDRMRNGMDEADRKQSHFDIYKQKREKEDKEE